MWETYVWIQLCQPECLTKVVGLFDGLFEVNGRKLVDVGSEIHFRRL